MNDAPNGPGYRQRGDQGDWFPRPDPTALTTEALHREVGNLREILEEKLVLLNTLIGVHISQIDEKLADQRRYYDAILAEKDTRYEERFTASQLAVAAAFEASEKAVAAAFKGREDAVASAFEASEKAVQAAFDSADKAITKAEISIEKRADATYVALGELQRLLGALMPRAEAEGRFASSLDSLNEIRKTYDASWAVLSDRVKGLEAVRQSKAESQIDLRGWIVALVAFVGLAVTIAIAFGGRGAS